jgi:hypothetical protein
MNKNKGIHIKDERIVLCRPFGGLNDMLVQIEKCYQYCRKFKRKLYIDGSIGGFLDDYSNYFISRDTNISFEKIDFLTPPFDVFPKCLYNDLYNYELYRGKEELTYFRVTENNIPITFDFNKKYSEQILVHAQGGGGNKGILALARLNLKDDIKLHIRGIIQDLKKQSGNIGKYDAVHVRNASYKTDYKSYFNEIKNKLDKTTFLCTDDYVVQQYAKTFFGDKLKPVTDIPDLSSCPIKSLEMNKYIDRYKTNIGTLTDLFILACADKIYYSPLSSGFHNSEPDPEKEPFIWYVSPGLKSGFLILAENLHNNKRIIYNMLYRNKYSFLSYHLALYEYYLLPVFSKKLRKFRKLFSLLLNNGILYTVRYIYYKLFKKETRNETFS